MTDPVYQLLDIGSANSKLAKNALLASLFELQSRNDNSNSSGLLIHYKSTLNGIESECLANLQVS